MSGSGRPASVIRSLTLRLLLAAVAIGTLPLHAGVSFVEYLLPRDTFAQPPKNARRITVGPDGAIWFTEYSVNKIGRITTTGVITEYPVSAGAGPLKITVGPDGNLWFTEYLGNAIGRMTSTGVLTEFPVPSHNGTPPAPWGITKADDGNLWFTESQWDISFPEFNRIGRMSVSGALTEYALPNLVPEPTGITQGPDGRLWYCETFKMAIGAISPISFAIGHWELPQVTRMPLEIVTGSDGNLWFTEPDQYGPAHFMGTITPSGVITELQLPMPSPPEDLIVGPDGYIWFTVPGTSQIGRVANGTFTFYTVPTTPALPSPAPPPDPAQPVGITLGPDGNLWFTDNGGYHIGSIRKMILNGPTVTSITPNSGPTIGGTAVTITGTNFQNGAAVTLGGVPATVSSVSPTSIAATTGPHAAGPVDVVVTNPDGGAGTLAAGFTYTPCGGTPPTATLSGTATICGGGSTTLFVTLTGTAPWKLVWSDGLTETGIGTSSWSRTVSPTTSTSYTVLAVADASCGGSGTGSADVTVEITPSAVISAPTVVCMGAPYAASVPDGGAGATYAWTLTNGTITTGTGTRSITFSPSAPGPMLLSVTVANGTCGASSSVDITAYARATATASGNATICSGQTATISLALTGLSPWTVTWSDGTSQLYATSAASRLVTPLATTTYTPTQVVDGTGCAGTPSGSAEIIVSPTPSAVMTTPSATCPNSTANTASVPVTSGASYAWTIAGGTITSGAGTNAITYTAGASGVVTLGATVTAANGCTATSSQTVTIRTAPTATVSGTATICTGAPANLSVALTGTPPWRVTWSDGTVQTTSSTPLARTVTPTANTTYTLSSVSDATCSGTVSGSAVLTLTPSPTADVSGAATVCSGDSAVVTAVITGTAPISLQWSDGVLMTGLAPGTVTRTVTPVFSTSYQVDVVTDATCTGRGTGGALVIVAPDPLASVIQAPLVMCTGATGIHATIPDSGPDATYAWTITNGTITAGGATNDITFTAGDTAGPLLIGVTVTLASGCSVSGNTTLTVAAAPEPPSISAPASAGTEEAGLVAQVTNHPAASYAWTIENGTVTAGAGTSQITFTSGLPGVTTLHVTETSMQGCRSATATLVIPVEGLSLSRVVPIVLDVTGLGGARFTSELTLANPGPAPAAVDITFTAADALSSSGSGTVPETIPAGRQLVIADALSYLRGKGLAIPSSGGQGGTLGITFRNLALESAPYASARTTAPSGNGRAGLAYGAPRLDQVSADAVNLFGLRQTAADRSNLALENAGTGGAVTLRVTLHSGTAGDARQVVLPDVTLAAGQWMQLNEVLASAGLTNGWAQVERVSGTDPFLAYAVFNDNTTNDGSFVPAIATTRPLGPQVLPVLVETGAFTSELVLANPGAKPIDVSLSFIESLAHPAGMFTGIVKLTLQPGEQQVIADAVDWLRGKGATIGARGPAYAGALSVQFASAGALAGGFVGARTAAPAPGGGQYGLFYTGSLASEAAMNAAWVFGLAQDAMSRSNLALVNGAATQGPVTVKYEVYDGATGQKAGESAPITIGPGGWKQIDAVLAKYGVTNGYVRVVKISGTPGFVAYGVVNDGATPSGGTSDGSFVPMTIAP